MAKTRPAGDSVVRIQFSDLALVAVDLALETLDLFLMVLDLVLVVLPESRQLLLLFLPADQNTQGINHCSGDQRSQHETVRREDDGMRSNLFHTLERLRPPQS